MKKWKMEHNNACASMLTNLATRLHNEPNSKWNKNNKNKTAALLGAMAGLLGHLAEMSKCSDFVFKCLAEGMTEVDEMEAERLAEKKFNNGWYPVDKDERL